MEGMEEPDGGKGRNEWDEQVGKWNMEGGVRGGAID